MMKVQKNKYQCKSGKLLYENIGRRIENWQRKNADPRKYKIQGLPAVQVKTASICVYLATAGYVFYLAFKAVVQANAPPELNTSGKQLTISMT